MATVDQTPQGQAVIAAYETFKDLLNVQLPAHKQSLDDLATRPIKG